MTTAYRNIARVVSPHGIKGEVSVEALRGLPFLLHTGMTVALTPPAMNRDRFCAIERADEVSGLAKFSGIDTLDDAEGISDCYVLAYEVDLDLSPLDVAYVDLVDRRVVDERYGELGRIIEVMETPANDVWVIDGAYGEVLVPVIDSVVCELPDTGAITVRVMDGLIDAEPAPASTGEGQPCA